jgi:hypothetical protein
VHNMLNAYPMSSGLTFNSRNPSRQIIESVASSLAIAYLSSSRDFISLGVCYVDRIMEMLLAFQPIMD